MGVPVRSESLRRLWDGQHLRERPPKKTNPAGAGLATFLLAFVTSAGAETSAGAKTNHCTTARREDFPVETSANHRRLPAGLPGPVVLDAIIAMRPDEINR
jgi:hypothetical protein